MLKPRPALTLTREVAQEHPHGGEDHPGRVAAVVPAPLRDELPEPAGRVRLRVVPQEVDQISDKAAIRGSRALADAPVDVHPPEKPLHPAPGAGSDLLDRDDALLPEMPAESAHTRADLAGAIP